MVTWENYEEYMMLDADGELDSIGKEALQAFITANPALKGELAAWQALKLQPDAVTNYPDKEGLLKREPKGILLTLRPYMIAAAAAVIAMLFLIPALWRNDKHELAEIRKKIIAPTKVISQDSGSHMAATIPAVTSNPHPSAIRNPQSEVLPIAIGTQSAIRNPKFEIITLPTITTQPLTEPVAAVDPAQLVYQEIIPAVITPEEHKQYHESGLLNIRLAAANKPAFDLLKQGLESRIAQASSAAKSIRETALVIRLGNGSVNLNF